MIYELSRRDERAAAVEDRRDWFSLAELAALDLPGLGADRRKIARRAGDERWDRLEDAAGAPLARQRAGRGGGAEYHFTALPGTAQLELARRDLLATRPQPAEADAEAKASARWDWYDRQNAGVKAEAQRRLEALNEIWLLEDSGLTREAALVQVCARFDVGRSTVCEWIKRVKGVPPQHRLVWLAPERKGGGAEAEIPDDIWTVFLSDYLRPERPTLASCYHRAKKIAAKQTPPVKLPSEASFRRRLGRDVDVRVVLLRRGLKDEFKRSIPDQRRTMDGMAALDLVNIDGHTFDVWVEHPEGLLDKKGNVVWVRPVLIAIQDIYSRKFLAWQIDLSENYLATRRAFADLFRTYGIPTACLLDNSRTFASKLLTGGIKTRFRGKANDGEAYGLLTSLGIQVRFAQVYHGQAKPIERAFRDFCDYIARGPACAGAYAGNTIANKPTNVGQRAVPWDEFEAIVAEGIADHNARTGRRGGVCNGRSFDQVFAESYAASVIRKADPAQLRIALLDAEQKRINRRDGTIALLGNRYWSQECGKHLGEKVIVRYDPEDLLAPVHVYSLDARYLFAADVADDVQFLDAKGAHAARKRRQDYTRAVKEAAKALDLRDAAELAALQAATEATAPIEAAAIQPVRHRNVVAKVKAAPVARSGAAAPEQRESEQSRILSSIGTILKLVE